MQKLSKMLGVAAISGAAAFSMTSAQAWWGGGPGYNNNSWMNDMFGDGSGDFSMSMSGGGRGWGRGNNRYRDYYGGPYSWGGPYGYGGYPGYGGWGGPYGYSGYPGYNGWGGHPGYGGWGMTPYGTPTVPPTAPTGGQPKTK